MRFLKVVMVFFFGWLIPFFMLVMIGGETGWLNVHDDVGPMWWRLTWLAITLCVPLAIGVIAARSTARS